MLSKQKKRKKEKSILSNKDTKNSNRSDKFRSNQLPGNKFAIL